MLKMRRVVRGSEEGGMVNPGLESLRMVQILELCGSLYLKREVNILCGCHDLIAKMFYEATEQWGWKGLTGAWEQYAVFLRYFSCLLTED